jgi:hypothetical protein
MGGGRNCCDQTSAVCYATSMSRCPREIPDASAE